MTKIKLIILLILTTIFFFRYNNSAFAADIIGTSWNLNSIPLYRPLASHVLISRGSKVFVVGGATVASFEGVYSADTGSNGTISTWTSKNSLPESRYGMAEANNGSYGYILGGLFYDGTAHYENTVYLSTFMSDGNVAPWQQLNSLPQALVEGEAVTVGNRLYFAGGTNGGGAHDDIYMAPINPDGTLGIWSTIGHLPRVLVTFGMVAYNNKIYIIGGNSNNSIRNEVYSTDVSSFNGSLSPWHQEGNLIQPFADKNQTVLVGNNIIIAGGADGFGTSQKVFYASINPDGSLAPWQQSASSLPQGISSGAMTYSNGYLYLMGGVGNGYQNTVYYAKVNDQSSFDLNVPLLKQTDPLWKDFTYDSANIWNPQDPSIRSWGCALTSAAMVFNYYGINKLPDGFIDLQPGTLNTWLKGQPDGYVGNGLVNWLALSRLSKQAKPVNSSFTSGNALEFSRTAFSTSRLASDLTNGNPGILEEPGHFIVSKGQTGSTFNINDPYYDRTDLTSYSNTALNINRFIPSHTDLSYIMAIVDSDVNITFKTSTGSAVGDSFIQNPLDEDGGNAESGPPVNIFLLPKPDSGNYSLNVASDNNKNYTVKIYFYNKDGDVKIFTQSGIVGLGDSDNYSLNFDKQNVDNDTTTKNVTFDSMINDLNTLCNVGEIRNVSCGPLLVQAKAAQVANQTKTNTNVARNLLNALYHDIDQAKGKFMTDNAQNIILSDIQALLAQ